MTLLRTVTFVMVSMLWASIAGAASTAPAKAFATAKAAVQINAHYTDRAVEPKWFTPSPAMQTCEASGRVQYLDEIQWSTWGGPKATGTAIGGRNCRRYDNTTRTIVSIGPAGGSPVTVTLSGSTHCAGYTIYTAYSLALAPGAAEPAGWPHLKSGRFPCNVSAPGCSSHLSPGRLRAKSPTDCRLGLKRLTGERKVSARWKPHTPPGQEPSRRRLLAAVWTGWGDIRTVGRGAMLDQHDGRRGLLLDYLWPGKVELSDPTWCPRLGELDPGDSYGNAFVYTSLRLTLYGNGVKEKKNQGDYYYDELAVKVRRMVGRAGLRKHVFTQRVSVTRAMCGF